MLLSTLDMIQQLRGHLMGSHMLSCAPFTMLHQRPRSIGEHIAVPATSAGEYQ